MSSFYLPSSEQVLSSDELYVNTGFYPTEDPSFLSSNGIYTVIPTPDPCDPYLYTSQANYTIVGDYADQSWSCVALPLATAKEGADFQLKQQTNQATLQFYRNLGYSPEVLVGVAAKPAASRPARYQDALDTIFAYAEQLNEKLNLVVAATTVDELNDIVNPPTGTINIGRGPGTEDLLAASFTGFSSVTLTESDTELYIPGTATTIAYSGSDFPATAACFALGDYVIQLREVATSLVIKEFECPLGLTDVTF